MGENLKDQLLRTGLSEEEAGKLADNFVEGLKELGLSDTPAEETPPTAPGVVIPTLTTATDAGFRTRKGISPALLAVGVRQDLVKKYAPVLEKAMEEYGVKTQNSTAMFLAQLLHESAMLTAVVENLNYSELNLVKVFKKYFDRNTAKFYARKPEKIANRVYANRMGNGNEESGDGFRYRGRGFIQLTGKANYIACGQGLGIDLIKNPDYLLTAEGAARSAGWFWKSRNLSRSGDMGDIISNTKLINGGLNGLEHRVSLYKKLLPLV